VLQVSHESIYQSLYVRSCGYVGVRLHRHLRRGRSARKPRRTQLNAPGKIRDKVMLSERPEEAHDRKVAGHWEGDLIVGSGSGSAIATLVERTTRFLVLVHLPNGHSSAALHDGVIDALDGLPVLLRRSLTWAVGHVRVGSLLRLLQNRCASHHHPTSVKHDYGEPDAH
jgi:IS30 family transposase